MKARRHCLLIALIGILAIAAPAADAQGLPAPEKLTADSLPRQWSLDRNIDRTPPSTDNWWKVFDDPTLVELISLAESNSYDLAATYRKIEMARLNLRTTEAGYFPTIGLSAGWNRSQDAGRISGIPSSPVTDYFSAGANLSWEIDVFGRINAQAKADRAGINVAKADFDAALISLAANVAKTYFQLRSVQQQIDATVSDIYSQEKIVAMTQTRFEVGLGSKLDVAQSRTVLYSSQANLPALESQEQAAINSLALLCGVFPEELQNQLIEPKKLPNPYQNVAAGVPADMLRNRPDIVAAEQQLAQYAAQAGVAKKDFLPSLSIQGSIGTASHEAKHLFGSHSMQYSVAPQLSWTLFDGLARNYRVAEAKQQLYAGIDSYNYTLLQAYTESCTAFSSYSSSLQQMSRFEKVLEQSDEQLRLSIDRYKHGLVSFNDVASAQISNLSYKISLIETHTTALDALIQIYLSLGGKML